MVILPTSILIFSKSWNSFSWVIRTSNPNIRLIGGNKTHNKLIIYLLITGESKGKYKKLIIQ